MKNLIIIPILLLIASCSSSNPDAEAIKLYLSDKLNDFKSYEPVSYDTVERNAKQHIVKHTFRADNAMNGTRLVTWYFRIGPDGTVNSYKTEEEYEVDFLGSLMKYHERWIDIDYKQQAQEMMDSINKADSVHKIEQKRAK